VCTSDCDGSLLKTPLDFFISAVSPRRPERRLCVIEAIGHAAVCAVGRLEYFALCPSPQLPAGAVHAVNPANRPPVMANLLIIRQFLAVEEDGAAKCEVHSLSRRATIRSEGASAILNSLATASIAAFSSDA
jgi:hypothetical protein